MKNTKRAWRRHHRRRMIARARRVFFMGMRPSDPDMQDWALRNYDHLKKCSCWMCGHRRKWYGPTIQERRMSQNISEDEG
jgi:hypothetical protein